MKRLTSSQQQIASYAIPIVMCIVLAIGSYRRGLERGGEKEKVAALDERSTAGARAIVIDTKVATVARAAAAPVKARARAARAQIHITPGSDSVYVAGELPIVSPGIVRELALSDSSRTADSVIIAADSSLILDYRSQLSRKDSTVAVLRAMKIPRCSVKCGVTIGVVAAVIVGAVVTR